MSATHGRPIAEPQTAEQEERLLDTLADAEIEAGKGVPHEKVRKWLARLAKGEKVPPPTA